MAGRPAFDVVVVGAGVVGLAIAARLARTGRGVLVLEAGEGIAREISARNSGVVHAGIYHPSESLKTRLCVRGREMLYERCERRAIPHRRLGKLIVACVPEERAALESLALQARANGVTDLELLSAARVTALEPRVRAECALLSPSTGIVDAHALAVSLLAEAEANGATLLLRHSVVELEPTSFGWRVSARSPIAPGAPAAAESEVDCGTVVNAAGLGAEAVARLAGLDVMALGYRLWPCKGDYFALAPGSDLQIGHLVYPVPPAAGTAAGAGLGIHATVDLGGRIRFGPDAEYVTRPDHHVAPEKAADFARAAGRYLPGLRAESLVPEFAGLRPKLAGPGEGFRDFVVCEESSHGLPGLVSCIGIESPGLTAALALAEYVEALLDG